MTEFARRFSNTFNFAGYLLFVVLTLELIRVGAPWPAVTASAAWSALFITLHVPKPERKRR